MSPQRHILTATFDWHGIALSVSFEPDWLGVTYEEGFRFAHLQIEAITPPRARLPITETGYRSHFLHPDHVAAAGGPVAYTRAWLDHAAQSPDWQVHMAATQQLSLF